MAEAKNAKDAQEAFIAVKVWQELDSVVKIPQTIIKLNKEK